MSQGVVTKSLVSLITTQVDEHALIVWYDPEGHYHDVAASFAHPKTTVARYDGSFLRLRREIDSLLNDVNPPRLVVYIPIDQAETDHALAELEAAGVVIQPGQQPPNRNTRLSLLARNALRPLRGETNALEIEKQVEAGKLSLADLDAIGEKEDSGVLSLVFRTSNPQEVALSFLASGRFDAEVEKKSAGGELAELLRSTFEVDLPGNVSLSEMRDRLTRHVLLTDLVMGLGDSVPVSLTSLKVARVARRKRTPAWSWPGPGGCAVTFETATSPPPARSSNRRVRCPVSVVRCCPIPRTADDGPQTSGTIPKPSRSWSRLCSVRWRRPSCRSRPSTC